MVKETHHSYKKEDDCQPITLIMRDYYQNDAYKARYAKLQQRYREDPEYRQLLCHRAKIYYYKRKARKFETECKNETENDVKVN